MRRGDNIPASARPNPTEQLRPTTSRTQDSTANLPASQHDRAAAGIIGSAIVAIQMRGCHFWAAHGAGDANRHYTRDEP